MPPRKSHWAADRDKDVDDATTAIDNLISSEKEHMEEECREPSGPLNKGGGISARSVGVDHRGRTNQRVTVAARVDALPSPLDRRKHPLRPFAAVAASWSLRGSQGAGSPPASRLLTAAGSYVYVRAGLWLPDPFVRRTRTCWRLLRLTLHLRPDELINAGTCGLSGRGAGRDSLWTL